MDDKALNPEEQVIFLQEIIHKQYEEVKLLQRKLDLAMLNFYGIRAYAADEGNEHVFEATTKVIQEIEDMK